MTCAPAPPSLADLQWSIDELMSRTYFSYP